MFCFFDYFYEIVVKNGCRVSTAFLIFVLSKVTGNLGNNDYDIYVRTCARYSLRNSLLSSSGNLGMI